MDRTVSIRLSADCLAILHNRAVNFEQEWGVRISPRPIGPGGKCQMGCTEDELIEGTRAAASEEHSRIMGRPMLIAITPLHSEVITATDSCHYDVSVSVFAHTHPRALMGWRLGPPSSGDLVAHLLLGNATNWRRNQQINTALVVATEGMYHYWILPAMLEKHIERLEAIARKLGPKHVAELKTTGEASLETMLQHREEMLTKFAPIYTAWEKQLQQHKDRLMEGDAAVALELARCNVLTKRLARFGIGFDFYPASEFKGGVTLQAASTVRP